MDKYTNNDMSGIIWGIVDVKRKRAGNNVRDANGECWGVTGSGGNYRM